MYEYCEISLTIFWSNKCIISEHIKEISPTPWSTTFLYYRERKEHWDCDMTQVGLLFYILNIHFNASELNSIVIDCIGGAQILNPRKSVGTVCTSVLAYLWLVWSNPWWPNQHPWCRPWFAQSTGVLPPLTSFFLWSQTPVCAEARSLACPSVEAPRSLDPVNVQREHTYKPWLRKPAPPRLATLPHIWARIHLEPKLLFYQSWVGQGWRHAVGHAPDASPHSAWWACSRPRGRTACCSPIYGRMSGWWSDWRSCCCWSQRSGGLEWSAWWSPRWSSLETSTRSDVPW